jgi:hypothetical protein
LDRKLAGAAAVRTGDSRGLSALGYLAGNVIFVVAMLYAVPEAVKCVAR